MSADLIQRIRSEEFRKYLENLLVEICEIDTTPDANPVVMRDRESAVFAVLERDFFTIPIEEIRQLNVVMTGLGGEIVFDPEQIAAGN